MFNINKDGIIFLIIYAFIYAIVRNVSICRTKKKIQRDWDDFSFWMDEEQKRFAFPIWMQVFGKQYDWPKNFYLRR